MSSDGAGIHAAQIIAAIEASAFTEYNIDRLLDIAVSFIPTDCTIARVVNDVREWQAKAEMTDWRETLSRISYRYGHNQFGYTKSNSDVVKNHAVVILSLLAGAGKFDRSLMIANTSGWDTDCNSGTVGCLLGIRGGLAAIDSRWRTPVADQLYLPSVDAGNVVINATRVADRLVVLGYLVTGEKAPNLRTRKGGAQFHFEYPGSLQGFTVSSGASLKNVAGNSLEGARSLAVYYPELNSADNLYTTTPTFFPLHKNETSYELQGLPTVHSGQ